MVREAKFRAVLLGTGSISKTHAGAMCESGMFNLTACWNRTAGRGRDFAGFHGIGFYPDWEEMLAVEKPDLVVNALSPDRHLLGMKAAAESGAHLLVEKPMSTSVDDCRKLIAWAREGGVTLTVSESAAFNACNLTYLRHRADFGPVYHALEINYRQYFTSNNHAWKTDPHQGFGGMLLNVGVHRIAKLRLLAGAEEISVSATSGHNSVIAGVEGHGNIFIRYANGVSATLMMCGYHNCGNAPLVLPHTVNANGYVLINNPLCLVNSGGASKSIPPDPRYSGNDYLNLYRALGNALMNKQPSPYGGEKGMRDVAVIMAALKSGVEKREVEIQEILKEEANVLLSFGKSI